MNVASNSSVVNNMRIKVFYFGLVRNVVKVSEETVTLPEGSTVRELVEILCQKHGAALRDAIFTADGTLGSSAMLVLDGINVLRRDGLATAITGGESMHVLLTTTAMAGG
ncbi:MAG: MoaD/ThiS family protein [Candidatus Binatia bacterium]